jgi:ribosome-binding factor A
VTVLGTEVADDLRTAKVFVTVMGTAGEQHRAVHGLNSARGFLQSRIADELQLRYTPVLTFVLDQGVKRSIEVSRALRDALDNADETSDGEEEPSTSAVSEGEDVGERSLSTGEP